ncbi:MAG TPA: cysteine--tRNA ligase [Limnochordia bacterium]|nr:cysteine--tRNA ligase [Limnochordia bacterium]
MGLVVYNTLTAKKEPFEPVEAGVVRMYSCGPTVYNYFHIGNARAFVVPDVFKRYFRYKGYRVTHVQNITDIEDKIIARARERGVTPEAIVAEYTQAFLDDAQALGCERPDQNPKATEHIPEMIDWIRRLIDAEHAYAADGDVYYAVRSFPGYGRLSKQGLEDLQVGVRIEAGEQKRDPLDFVLWKGAKAGEPAWPSPWGEGRPGWHLECSVMSMKYLGESFDIHTGGSDLIFPHHENEIAQSECLTHRPLARYWLHNGFINVDGEKMSKSVGNFIVVRDLLREHDPEVLRLFLVNKHYRAPIEMNEAILAATGKSLERLRGALREVERIAGPQPSAPPAETKAVQSAREAFEQAMDDDFNTSGALAALFELAREINRAVRELGERAPSEAERAALHAAGGALRQLGGILGILQSLPAEDRSAALTGQLIELLLTVRTEARGRKDFATADSIRDRLADLGVVVEDTAQGPRWHLGGSGEA